MSEIFHPPIRQGIGPGVTFERVFFEEAYMLLAQGGIPLDETVQHIPREVDQPPESVIVTSLVTDRVDMVAEDDDTSAAMRLRLLPV